MFKHRLLLISFSALWLIFSMVGYSQSDLTKAALDKLSGAHNAFEAQRHEENIKALWLESGSAVSDILMERAIKAESNAKFQLAEALYDRVIRLRPDYAEAWNKRGQLNLRADRWDEAIIDFDTALTLESRHFEAWSHLGMIFLQIDAHNEALRAFDRALGIHPYFAPAKIGRSHASKEVEGLAL